MSTGNTGSQNDFIFSHRSHVSCIHLVLPLSQARGSEAEIRLQKDRKPNLDVPFNIEVITDLLVYAPDCPKPPKSHLIMFRSRVVEKLVTNLAFDGIMITNINTTKSRQSNHIRGETKGFFPFSFN